MALSGSLTYINTTGSGVFETITINVPADAPSGSEYYDYRGQSVTQSVETNTLTSESYDGVYVKVTSIQIWPPRIESDSTVYLEPTFRIYGSKASRSADIDNYILSDFKTKEWNTASDTDPYQLAYDLIKAEFPTDTLTDV